MKKLFISQPMNGKTDEEILDARGRAAIAVEVEIGELVEVIDSFFQGAPASENPLRLLAGSIHLMADADIVCFVPGWEQSRGCKIEHECAEEYGKTIIYL